MTILQGKTTLYLYWVFLGFELFCHLADAFIRRDLQLNFRYEIKEPGGDKGIKHVNACVCVIKEDPS